MNSHKSSLEEEWCRSFGSSLPVGFSCREVLRDRWLRIHSLPGSKRYASTDEERDEILIRQNAVADYVLGNEVPCVLFLTTFGDCKDWREASIDGIIPQHFSSHHGEDGDFEFFFIHKKWTAGSMDELIISVADDISGPILLANLSNGAAYAPYDGGADLFLPSHAEVVRARESFSEWLSEREDGL